MSMATRTPPSNITLVPYSPKPKYSVFSSPTSLQFSGRPIATKCKVNNEAQGGSESSSKSLKSALSGIVDKQVEELLNREENKELLDGLEKAQLRVEKARRELAEIERRELEAIQFKNYIDKLESKASEIAECQREILEARAKVEEAERLLNETDGDSGVDSSVNKEKERLESIKAASVSAIIGTLAGLPISLTQVSSIPELLLPSAVTFFSCALFGVTFRYAVRRDLDNFQLKTGTSAAFGFVKGLSMLASGPALELNPESFLSHAFDGFSYVSQNLFIFAFAAVSLDFGFKMGLLSPFPITSSSENAE